MVTKAEVLKVISDHRRSLQFLREAVVNNWYMEALLNARGIGDSMDVEAVVNEWLEDKND